MHELRMHSDHHCLLPSNINPDVCNPSDQDGFSPENSNPPQWDGFTKESHSFHLFRGGGGSVPIAPFDTPIVKDMVSIVTHYQPRIQ